MNKKIMVLFIVCVLAIVRLSGCGNEPAAGGKASPEGKESTEGKESPEGKASTEGKESPEGKKSTEGKASTERNAAAGRNTPELSGSIRMVGSTSMEKLVNALAESFMEKYRDVDVTAEFVGSGAGIGAVISGTADIGNSSRKLKAEEKAEGAVENIVAIDGIAVCAAPDNGVTGLTKQQLTDIYTGAVTNWSEVGGEEFPIVVLGHEAGSGTREAFEELLGVEDACSYANELGSTGAVMARIAVTPGAIGYVSLDVVDDSDSVIVLALDNVAPTVENIRTGKYLLSRPFVMATKGEIGRQSELLQVWFDYVLGEEGRAVASQVGLIPVD